MLKEPVRRIRFLSRDEAQRLLAVLPEHLGDMAAFSLATGLRAANVTGLQRSAGGLAACISVGASRSGQGASSHRTSVEHGRTGSRAKADRQTPDARVQLSR